MFNFVYKQGWISKVFLAFLAFSFILGTAIMWGPGSWNFGFGNYLIQVGDIKITPKEFLVELSLSEQQNSQLPKEILKKKVYSTLLIKAILAYLAEKNGFYVSDKEIEDFIKRNFTDKNGKFSVKLFESYLKALQLTPNEFKDIVKKILLADHYKRAVFATTYANKATLEALLLAFKLQVEGQIYKVSPKLFENLIPAPSEEELQKIYKEKLKNFENSNKTVERVLIYEANSSKESAKIYKLLKEGENVNQTPSVVITKGETVKNENLQKLAEETFTKKGITVKKLENGTYVVAVYKKETLKRNIPLDKVKKELEAIYKEQKVEEYLEKHKEEVIQKVLNGTIEVAPQKTTLIGFQLIDPKGWALTYDDLFAILKGKKIFTTKVGNELWILKIEKVSLSNNFNSEVISNYKIYIRNNDYLTKLGKLIDNFMKNNPNLIKINQKLLQQI